MVQVRRLAYATFETPDVVRLADYYARVLGFSLLSTPGMIDALRASGDGADST